MNLANNHAFDYGASGFGRRSRRSTGRAPAHRPARPGDDPEGRTDPGRARRLRLVPVGRVPDGHRPARSGSSARRRRRADVVIVTMHAGAEGTDHQHVRRGAERYLGENRGDVVRFAHAVVDAGRRPRRRPRPARLRGMEWYKGRLIAYSLGNFAGYRVFSLGGPALDERDPAREPPRRRHVRDRPARPDDARRARASRRSTRPRRRTASCGRSRSTTSAAAPSNDLTRRRPLALALLSPS